jgi:hypothetical protein
MTFYGIIVFEKLMFLGGGRRGGFGCCGGMFEDALLHSPGLHFYGYGAIGLPLGNRKRGSIPNIVRFIPSFNIYFYYT